MQIFNLDYFIVACFLIVTLVIGLSTGRGIKNIREYALANRVFGVGALVLTWLATDIAGETVLDMTDAVRNVGVIQPLTVLGGVSIALLMQALVFAPRFAQFTDCITMGDVMRQLYGAPTQVITGVLSFSTALCIAGMELTVIGLLCEHLLSIDFRFGVGVGGMLLIAYTAHGGMRSVAFTDLFQGLMLFAILPVIAATALQKSGGLPSVFTQTPEVTFQLLGHPKAGYYFALFLSLSVFQFSVIDPALIQRILMGRSPQQLRNQFFIVVACSFALMCTLLLLGLVGMVLYPHVSSDIHIMVHMVNHMLPVGLKGLAISGLFAITMATFDSFLHAAGLTLTHDVIHPLSKYFGYVIDELRWVRYITLLAGLVVMGVGFMRSENLYDLVLLSYKFVGPLLAFPLFSGVCGLKPNQLDFYVASGVTAVVLILSEWLVPTSYNHWVPIGSVSVNGILFLGMHAIRNGGFVVIDKKLGRIHSWGGNYEYLFRLIVNGVPTPSRVIQYSKQRVNRYGAPYILFGIFCCVNYIFPYFMWGHADLVGQNLSLYFRITGTVACGIILLKDQWSVFLLTYLPTFWHFTLLYCLPFTSTVMFLITQGSTEWLINVAISILFLVVLVDWLTFIILAVLGLVLGLCFYQVAVGPIHLSLDFSTSYLLVYQVIFATLIGLLFARRRQKTFDNLSMQYQTLLTANQEHQASLLASFQEKVRLLKTLPNAGMQDLLRVVKLIKEIRVQPHDKLHPLVDTAAKLEAVFLPMAIQLRSVSSGAINFLQLSLQDFTVPDLIARIKAQLTQRGNRSSVSYHIDDSAVSFVGDINYLQTLLINSITALQTTQNEESPLLIGVEATQLRYALPSVRASYTRQVPALRFTVTTKSELSALNTCYEATMSGLTLDAPKTSLELLLLDNQRIVKAHYGNLYSTTDTFTYVLPATLREIRPKSIDVALGIMPNRADESYPGAREQEQHFLQKVAEQGTLDLELIKSVIELIKWYHGSTRRQTGEPFYLHPIAVAQIVLDYSQDEATVIAALLHDTVEDTRLLLSDVEAAFGIKTARIVDTVTHLESHAASYYKIRLSSEENMIMLSEAEDSRALYVKLADRLHNMRTISGKSPTSQVRTAKETLKFFVPQAQKLGLTALAEELRTRSWEVIDHYNKS